MPVPLDLPTNVGAAVGANTAGGTHYTGGFMKTHEVLPITKWQARSKNDRKASKFYSNRLLIDQSADERRVMRQLREPWDE